MVLSLLLASCAPAVEEEEEVAVPPAAPKEITVAASGSAFEIRVDLEPCTVIGGKGITINNLLNVCSVKEGGR